MAIEIVGTTTEIVTGEPGTLTSIEVALPSGLQLDDVVHIAAYLPRTKFATWEDDGTRLEPWKADKSSSPAGSWRTNVPGWTLVDRYRYIYQEFPDDTILLRRIITGAEGPTVTLEIGWTLDIFDPPVTGQVIIAAAAVVAHRGVDLTRLYASPPRISPWPTSWNTGALDSSRLAQVRFYRRHDFAGGLDVDDQIPATPDPLVNTGSAQPPEWDVLTEERLPAIETIDHYRPSGTVAATQVLAVSTVVLDVPPGAYTPGAATGGPWEAMPGTSNTNRFVLFSLMDPTAGGMPIDPPVPAGIPGLTGSGWVIPEWDGREHRILDPLRCTVWTQGEGEDGPELVPDTSQGLSQLEPVGLDAMYNGVGACVSAQASFPADPGVTPWQHALKFQIVTDQDEDPEEATVWWTGVVRNVRQDGGLWIVDLLGLWDLLNDARVQLDEDGVISRPEHGVITDTLMLGGGDPTAVEIENAADRQQTWSEFLNKTFRINPDAAWGIGPDQGFVMGLPQNAGFLELDTEDPVVTEVEAGEFLLPPFVTEWWAEETSGGPVLSGSLIPPPGLLTPNRLVQSRLGDLGNLITPAEASLPTFAGPSHTIRIAGIAVPPLRADNLPMGSQMVAGARVVVNVGEEGSMPTIVTTLTTVALPYGGG